MFIFFYAAEVGDHTLTHNGRFDLIPNQPDPPLKNSGVDSQFAFKDDNETGGSSGKISACMVLLN